MLEFGTSRGHFTLESRYVFDYNVSIERRYILISVFHV